MEGGVGVGGRVGVGGEGWGRGMELGGWGRGRVGVGGMESGGVRRLELGVLDLGGGVGGIASLRLRPPDPSFLECTFLGAGHTVELS